MHRQIIIQCLILDCMDRFYRCHQSTWLAAILEGGFVGFAHMSDQQLRQECADRGLDCENHLLHLPPEADDEDAAPDIDRHLLEPLGLPSASPGDWS
jgi:hypothetical protein